MILMVKVEEVATYFTQCPGCGKDNMMLEIMHYDDGSILMTEQCPCGHYDEEFFEAR